MMPLDLVSRLRSKAAEMKEMEADGQAAGIAWCVRQLEQALQEQDGQLLTLQEAAVVSGYSPDHLGRMVRAGDIPNLGRPGAPRIMLKDLPRKAKRAAAVVATDDPHPDIGDATAIVRSVIIQGG